MAKIKRKAVKAYISNRNKFQLSVAAAALPVHAYESTFKGFYPESYYTGLAKLDSLATEFNIPYDQDFHAHYLGSFAGALYTPFAIKTILTAYENYTNNGHPFTDVKRSPSETLDHDSRQTKIAFALSAGVLTAREIYDAGIPNRTFDTGDMTAYALALAIMAGGLYSIGKRTLSHVSGGHTKDLH